MLKNSEPKYLQTDIQAQSTGFAQISIKKVGVRHIVVPMRLRRKCGDASQEVLADISAYCNLRADTKGVNMSRNARTLFQTIGSHPIQLDKFIEVARELRDAHQSSDVYVKAVFQYLLIQTTPIDKLVSYEPVTCVVESFIVEGKETTLLEVSTTESSCCPCSKNMSLLVNNLNNQELEELQKLSPSVFQKVTRAGFGAHNQRSEIKIKVELNSLSGELMWIEDIVDVASRASSAQTFNVLKRPDEKWVTECQYLGGYFDEDSNYVDVPHAGPKFCEDIARDAALELQKELGQRILAATVVVENNESIHTRGNAVAVVVLNKDLK